MSDRPSSREPPSPPKPRRSLPVWIATIGSAEGWQRFGWAVLALVMVYVTVWALLSAPGLSVPLFLGFVVAYLFAPLIDSLERRGVPRTLSILGLGLVILLVLSAAVFFLGPQLLQELVQLPDKLADMLARLVMWLERTFGVELPTSLEDILQAAMSELRGEDPQALAAPFATVVGAIFGGTVSALGVLAGLVMIPVFAFFFLRDYRRLLRGIESLIPPRYRPGVAARFRDIDRAMGGFVRGQLLVAAVLAALYSLGLWLAGLSLPVVVGVIAGLGNMIPYVGTLIGLVLATGVAVLEWHGFGQLLLIYAVFGVVQVIESWIVTPRIVGHRVGLSPLVVISAVLLFGDLLGFIGILLAVPMAAVLKILLAVLVDAYRGSSLYRHAKRP